MLVYERVSWNQSVCEDMTIFDMISDDIWWVVWHDHIWDVDPLAPTHSQAKMARNQWDFIGDRANFYEKRCGAVGDFQLFGLFHMFVCVVFFNSHTKGAVHFWMLFVVQQSQPGKCSCVIYWVVFLRLKAPKRSWQLWNRWLKKVSPVMLGMMVMNHGVTSLAMILGYIWCDSTSHLWDSFQSLVNACTQAFAWPLAFMFFFI